MTEKRFKLGCPHRRLINNLDYCTNMYFKNHVLEKRFCDYYNCGDVE